MYIDFYYNKPKQLDYSHIYQIQMDKGISFAEFARRVGKTDAGLRRMIDNKRLKVSVFEKICDVLEVSPLVFFGGKYSQVHAVKTQPVSVEKLLNSQADSLKAIANHLETMSRTIETGLKVVK